MEKTFLRADFFPTNEYFFTQAISALQLYFRISNTVTAFSIAKFDNWHHEFKLMIRNNISKLDRIVGIGRNERNEKKIEINFPNQSN
jgi:hypothetical protein